MRFEIRKSNSAPQPYYWRVVAKNGEVLATSETYTSKTAAKSAVDLVQVSAGSASVVDLA